MMTDTLDLGVLVARRNLRDAGRLLAAGLSAQRTLAARCGWHGPAAHPEQLAACLVADQGPHADLVGKVLVVRRGERRVTVLCVERADHVEPISLTRRAWLDVAPLAAAPADLDVEVLG